MDFLAQGTSLHLREPRIDLQPLADGFLSPFHIQTMCMELPSNYASKVRGHNLAEFLWAALQGLDPMGFHAFPIF